MLVQIVYIVSETLAQETFETADGLPAMARRGWEHTGAQGGAPLRFELRGQPKFRGLCGPM